MLEICLPSSIEYLPLVDSVCQAFCVWAGLSEDVTEQISIGVIEAATNAVVHGNQSERCKKVRVLFEKEAREVKVSVTDEGAGFDPARVGNPTEGCNLLKECGRGIYIMKQVMDRVEFESTRSGGTRVRMAKTLKEDTKCRVLCIDYGEKRLGLALSDELGMTAQPFGKIDIIAGKDVVEDILKIAQEKCVTEVVVGMPLTLKGEVARSASRVIAFTRNLNQRLGLAIVTWDERLSSKEGERILIEAGIRREKRKDVIDSVSAAIILQSYLDARKRK
jgi:putative Holliday junction resolvase